MEILTFVILLFLLAVGLFIYKVVRLGYLERKKYFDAILYISLFIIILIIGTIIGHHTKFYIGGILIFICSIILFKSYYKKRW